MINEYYHSHVLLANIFCIGFHNKRFAQTILVCCPVGICTFPLYFSHVILPFGYFLGTPIVYDLFSVVGMRRVSPYYLRWPPKTGHRPHAPFFSQDQRLHEACGMVLRGNTLQSQGKSFIDCKEWKRIFTSFYSLQVGDTVGD